MTRAEAKTVEMLVDDATRALEDVLQKPHSSPVGALVRNALVALGRLDLIAQVELLEGD